MSEEPIFEGDEELLHGGKVMSVWDHLAELRTRIVRSMMIIFVLFAVAFAYAEKIINFLKQPLVAALPSGVDALHFTGPLDIFVVDMKVAMIASIVLGCPVWLYQFWKFFEPALYPRERKYILPFIVISTVLFFLGVAFCFYVMLPLSLDFLMALGMEVGTPLITIKDYVSLLLLLIAAFGITFEVPVLLVLLAMLDVITVEGLIEYRKFVVIGILVIAAVLTPPDPVSQIAMAIPLYLMYELAIVVIRLLKGRGGSRAPGAHA